MGSRISNNTQKTVLLLGLENSGIIEFYNKINENIYKIILSYNYKDYDNYSNITDIIIYFIDITRNVNYKDTILLSKLSKNKKKPIYIFLNIQNINFCLNIKETELIINYITNTYNLFNKNITFIEYLDTITKNDILNIIKVL